MFAVRRSLMIGTETMESVDVFTIFGSLALVALFIIMFVIEKTVIEKRKPAGTERGPVAGPKKKRPS